MNSELEKIMGPIEYIKEAWGIYTKKENFIFFAKIMAVLIIATSSVRFVSTYYYPTDYLLNSDFTNIPMLIGFIIISIVSVIVGLWSQTTQYFALIKMGDPEKEIFKIGYKKIGRFLLLSLVLGLIILGGVLLLIIPALIFGVWYSFSMFLVLDKGMGIKEALRTSKQMVSGRFWKVLGRSAVFGLATFLISFLLSLIPYAGVILLSFITPLFLLPGYLLYKDLDITV